MITKATVYIHKGRERSVQRFHPWIFSGSIERMEGDAVEGDLVQVMDSLGNILGVGHLCVGSISVKLLAFRQEVIDSAWLTEKLKSAMALRQRIGLPGSHTNVYRLVHGEGDGLPGLVIDIYNDVAVIQPHSVGFELMLKALTACLKELGFKNVVHKGVVNEKTEVLAGKVSERVLVLENNMKLHVDILGGQKTGLFIDQRDNRALLFNYSKGKSVLNVFSYTGGFSISALQGGASEAISLDSAAKALAVADENAMLNEVSKKHRTLKTDAVPFLENMTEKYDIIVLDPPAFAKHKSARSNAIKAYRRINEAAIRCINNGGMLFTFSCSQVIDTQLFYDIVASAAINVGRKVSVLHHLRQPADHPVSIYHPEGEYLKGLVLNIE